MYYAIFDEIINSDIAEFKTGRERDEWVNFQDEFSRDMGITKDNCFFNRAALIDKEIINSVVNDKTIKVVQDEFLPYIKWYLRSNMGK